MNVPIISGILFGALLFIVFYFVNKHIKIDFLYGLFGLSFIVILSSAFILFADQNNPFVGVGMNIVLVLASFAFLGYTIAWVFTKKIIKK